MPDALVGLANRDEWVWGWDPTPGIVSVHASLNGRALVWRRLIDTGALVREDEHFRPWILLASLTDLKRGGSVAGLQCRELDGPGALRYLVRADDGRSLIDAVLRGASERLGRPVTRPSELADIEPDAMLALPADEQYLVATGRTYFKQLTFDQIHRLQFDLETTGLNAHRDRIFMVSVRDHTGATDVLEDDAGEADLIRRLVLRIRAADPDVIENHNLFGFDLPFLYRRARTLGVPLALGRTDRNLLQLSNRFVVPGRELIDTLDAVWRYDFATRELPGHGLKAVARYLGLARADREYIPGRDIYRTWRVDPERVRRYASHDVEEVADLSRIAAELGSVRLMSDKLPFLSWA